MPRHLNDYGGAQAYNLEQVYHLASSGCLVFTTATALFICRLLPFLFLAFLQSSLSIRPIQGTHQPPVRSGYQNAVHVTSVRPFEDRLKRCVCAGGLRAQFHHLFHWPLSVTIKAICPYCPSITPPSVVTIHVSLPAARILSITSLIRSVGRQVMSSRRATSPSEEYWLIRLLAAD